ncbi:MAG: hypothetical protein ACI8PZ_000792 [Myxococcota bacterium]
MPNCVVSIALIALFAGCSSTAVDKPGAGDSVLPSSPLADLDPAPSHLSPSSEAVHGQACAFGPERWAGDARGVLEHNWDAVGKLTVDGRTFDSPDALLAHFASASPASAEQVALALNVLLNDLGLYGKYADLGSAQIADGTYTGVTANTLLAAAGSLSAADARDMMGRLNDGFGNCPPEWYEVDGPLPDEDYEDADGDGIPDAFDCAPADDTVGVVLYSTEFDADDGDLNAPAPLAQHPWDFDGDSSVATGGGQQALVGSDESYGDVVVFATVTAQGTKPSCGFDCEQVCGDYVPEGDCYSPWDAFALGILTAESTDTGVLTVSNSGDYDVCLDGSWSMWDALGTQALTIGNSDSGLDEYRVPAGGTLDFFYGSWTTDNGVEERYLGENPWWCYQRGVYFTVGIGYDMLAALLPDDFREFIEDDSDWDADGVEDHVDWASVYGVQTQSNMWDYQGAHAVGIIGKKAASTGSGTIATTLRAQNGGEQDLLGGVVTDTVPANWELVACDIPADSVVDNDDGSTSLSWDVAIDGCESDCLLIDEVTITCEVRHKLAVDVDHIVLPAASFAFNDTEDDEVSHSMPAVAFDYDHDSDGAVRCGRTDRWRVGVLARSALDADQDEGYHGYRCAVSSNSVEDCHNPGQFLQIGEFEDLPEDGISSECEDDCPENTSFTQHARTDHDGAFGNVADGDVISLSFWAVEDGLYCSATNAAGDTVVASSSDASFGVGASGMSTLNAFGDYEHLKVCEAFATPE